MFRRVNNLFSKIFYPLVVLFVFGAGLLIFLFVNNQTRNLEQALITEHILLSDIISSQVESSYYKGQWPFKTLKKVEESKSVVFWSIVNPSGEVEIASNVASWGQKIDIEDFDSADIRIKDGKDPYSEENIKVIVYPLQIREEGKRWVLLLGISFNSVRETSRQLIAISILFGLVIFLLLIVFSFSLAKTIVKPVKKLVKATKVIGSGRLDYFIEKESNDEVGALTDAFNNMVSTLKQSTVSLNYFNNIIETMGDALIVTDARGQIELVNSGVTGMLAYAKDEIVGKPFSLVLSDRFSIEKDRFEKGELDFWEGFWKTKDGKEIPVLCSRTFVKDDKNDVVSVVYAAKDITDIKKAERDLLEAYRKLKDTQNRLIQSEKMAAVGRLAGGIAHEIRNPLAIIMQGIHLIEVMMQTKTEELCESIEMIKSSVKRADGVISRLLSYSRASRLKTIAEDIRAIIDEGIAIVENQAKLNNIEIERNYGKEPVFVDVDRFTLAQIFLNLTTNAIDAMSEGGKIIIKIKKEENFCIVTFQDSGEGMPEKTLSRIFEPFYTTKSPGKGTGLGLAMVHLIVERHNGTISVESQEKKGTKFTIKFPLSKQREERSDNG